MVNRNSLRPAEGGVYDPYGSGYVDPFGADYGGDQYYGGDDTGYDYMDPFAAADMGGGDYGGSGGFEGGDLASLLLGAGDPNMQIPSFNKYSPMSNSQAFSFVDKVLRPVEPAPRVDWDRLLEKQLANYKRSLGDADTQATYGLDMYSDPRTSGIVQGYTNDLAAGKITPEEAMRNFLYRTGQTDSQGRERVAKENETSLTIEMIDKAKNELNKRRARMLGGKNETTASRESWDWLDKNFRGVDKRVDELLDANRPGVWDEKTGKYTNNTETGMNDRFARDARKLLGELSSGTSDEVGAKISKYAKDPRLDPAAYRTAMENLRNVDPRLDQFFAQHTNPAAVATDPRALEEYNRLIGELTSAPAAARRRGLPAPDAPGDLEWMPHASRAAVMEMFNSGSRQARSLPRPATEREQVRRMINTLLVQRLFQNPKR